MVRALLLALLALSLIGCRVSGNIEDLAATDHVDDYRLTVVIVNARAPADNASKLPVTVILKNSDGTFVSGFTPNFIMVSGSGVTFEGCTVSNARGRSQCHFRSSLAGDKVIRLNNIGFSIDKTITFDPVASSVGFQIVSSSEQKGTAPGGWGISSSVGNFHDSIQTTSSGYTIFTSIQGNLESTK